MGKLLITIIITLANTMICYAQTLLNPSKIYLPSGKLIIGSDSNVGSAVSVSGDVSINYLGVSTVAAPWSGITSKPTTLSGYGITDALSSSSTVTVAQGGTGLTSIGGTNRLIYTSTTNNLTSLTTANSSVLTTSSGGSPQWTAQGTAFNAAFGTGTSNIPQIGSALSNSLPIATNSSGQLVTKTISTFYTLIEKLNAIKTADQSTTTTASLVDVSDLSVTATSSTKYKLHGVIFLNASAANGLKVGITVPSGTLIVGVKSPNTANNNIIMTTITASNTASSTLAQFTASGSTIIQCEFNGTISISSTGGTVKLQMASNNASNTITALTGSYLTLETIQ